MTEPIHENKDRFNSEVAQIRNRPDFSTEAERRYLDEAYAKAKHDRMVAEHKKEQQRSLGELERKVFEVGFPLNATPHKKETFRMSHRDAYDPPERVEALTNLLESAGHTGDGHKADVVYHLTVERGHFGVADTYRKTGPKAKKRWDKYSAARQEEESLGDRLFGWVVPQKPTELNGAVLPGEGFEEAR